MGTEPANPMAGHAADHGDPCRRLLDRDYMLAVFRRELPRLSDRAIAVTGCRSKLHRRRAAAGGDQLELVYRVAVAVDGGPPRDFLLLGTAPAVGVAAADQAPAHPWAAPFQRLSTWLPDLALALRFFPCDPALPALAELTGAGPASWLAPHLPECRRTAIEKIACEVSQYKPWKRAVLRVTAQFADGSARACYVKAFADDRGAAMHDQLAALWAAARSASSLRLPEPLGYDARRRLWLLSEAPGERHLTAWIRCLRKGRPLPAGVDVQRVERALAVAARALAELQQAAVQPTERRTFAGEVAGLQAGVDAQRAGPQRAGPQRELAARADALLARLRALVPQHEQLLPAHGGFRHQQMVGDETGLCIIDWDGLCRADPALDAATLLAHLRCEPGADAAAATATQQLAAHFRREFLAHCPHVGQRQLARWEAWAHTERLVRGLRRAARDDALEAHDLAAAAAQLLDAAARGDPGDDRA